MDLYDKFDYEMCGDEADEKVVTSEGARLAMVFSSGELHGRGFKAKYTFETGKRLVEIYIFLSVIFYSLLFVRISYTRNGCTERYVPFYLP